MKFFFVKLLMASLLLFALFSPPQVDTNIEDFFLPGSQPGESGNLETPNKCDNCHGGYDAEVEPAFNWRGSMMSQAARDPLFYSCLAIAEQDAPGSGDLCIRCHTPQGWLEGRSVPTDGSALNVSDREGITCDFCHKMVKPALLGNSPYPDDQDYMAGTYGDDQNYIASMLSNPAEEIGFSIESKHYSANGMYVTSSSNAKRGPYVDAAAKHQMYYSPYHRESALCGTCHDVSNPVFYKSENGKYIPNDHGQRAQNFNPHSMLPIERTYSEWTRSDFSEPGGVSNTLLAEALGRPLSTCQDCHMQDVSGLGANKRGTPRRTDLPLHDMTGGNTFIPTVIDQAFPGEANPAALQAGIKRATFMLQHAARLEMNVDATGLLAEVKVTNETGHKLPSGYPEGRRIWINVNAWGANDEHYESGHYDFQTAVLTHDADIKVYEVKPGLSEELAGALGLDPGPSFHFVLNDIVTKDNRIPPPGFTNAAFEEIQAAPVNYSYADGQNFDITTYSFPFEPVSIEVTLYYQTTSKEYVEFLRDENITNDWGQRLYDLWEQNGKSAPVVMQSLSWTNGSTPGPTCDDGIQNGEETGVDCGGPECLPCETASCDPPVSTQYTQKGKNRIEVNWPAVDGASSYECQYREVGGNWSVKTTNSPPVTLTGLKAGRTYEYQVRTVCGAEYSVWIPEPPQQFALGNAIIGGMNTGENTTISIYPNPATHLLHVETDRVVDEKYNISVIDKYGREVKSLRKDAGPSITINVGDLPAGIYFLRVQTEANQPLVRKFVVQP